MKLGLYAIYDTASGVYDGPFKARTDAEALRAFEGIVADANHPVGQHPEDYSLVQVGEWNDGTAEVEASIKQTLITGLEAVAKLRQVNKFKQVELEEEIANAT